MSRFKKSAVLAYISRRMDQIQSQNHFDLRNGTSQLDATDIDRCVAYGQYEALRALAEDIEGGYVISE